MLEGTRIGLKVDVDTLRGTREGVPRLVELCRRLGVDATFYFSVGPDNTGRAIRRVFRKGFAEKVARTSVVKHYGLKTLTYGVLLPGPDIGRRGGNAMRAVRDAGLEVGLHTYDHIKWQDYVATADLAWTQTEFQRGMDAFKRVFGEYPRSHAAAGWQINAHALRLEAQAGLDYASDSRGDGPFWPAQEGAGCVQLPTTLPTFDELLGLDGVGEHNIDEALFRRSLQPGRPALQVFTLHAELEGMRLLGAFEALLGRWRHAGARLVRMADIHVQSQAMQLPRLPVELGQVAGRSGTLAVQGGAAVA